MGEWSNHAMVSTRNITKIQAGCVSRRWSVKDDYEVKGYYQAPIFNRNVKKHNTSVWVSICTIATIALSFQVVNAEASLTPLPLFENCRAEQHSRRRLTEKGELKLIHNCRRLLLSSPRLSYYAIFLMLELGVAITVFLAMSVIYIRQHNENEERKRAEILNSGRTGVELAV